jgi:hypothetical protein
MKNEDAEYIYSLKKEARSMLDSAYENGLSSIDLPESDIEFLEYAADDIYEDDPELGEEIWDFLADSTQGEPLHEDLEFERNAAGKVQVKDVLNGKAKTLTAADAPETYRFAKAVYKTLQDKGKAGDVNKEFNLNPAPDVRKTAADDTVVITPDDGSPAYQIPGREIRKYLESTLGKNTRRRRMREDFYDDDYDVADDIDYDVEMTDYDDYNGNGDYEYLTDEDDERTLSDIMPTRRRFFGGDSDGYSEQYRQMLASDDGEYLDTKKGLLTKMEKYNESRIKKPAGNKLNESRMKYSGSDSVNPSDIFNIVGECLEDYNFKKTTAKEPVPMTYRIQKMQNTDKLFASVDGNYYDDIIVDYNFNSHIGYSYVIIAQDSDEQATWAGYAKSELRDDIVEAIKICLKTAKSHT